MLFVCMYVVFVLLTPADILSLANTHSHALAENLAAQYVCTVADVQGKPTLSLGVGYYLPPPPSLISWLGLVKHEVSYVRCELLHIRADKGGGLSRRYQKITGLLQIRGKVGVPRF